MADDYPNEYQDTESDFSDDDYEDDQDDAQIAELEQRLLAMRLETARGLKKLENAQNDRDHFLGRLLQTADELDQMGLKVY